MDWSRGLPTWMQIALIVLVVLILLIGAMRGLWRPGNLGAPWSRLWVSSFYGLFILIWVYEFWAVLDKNARTPAITHIIVAEFPAWFTLGLLTWLLLHFSIRYFKWTGWGPL